ncbi:MAG: (2Fe-2S)-binding protein [Planctomycetota bacterium]
MAQEMHRTEEHDAQDLRFTRRAFMKGIGAAAVTSATAVSGLGSGLGHSGLLRQDSPVLGPGEASITLQINGEKTTVAVEPRETLSELLRERLGLTGTKEACERGTCGACTVLLDGRVVNSCMVLAIDLEGRDIRTIEGLAQKDELHPVQKAFCEQDAMQCGYCTPGMIMATVGLLEQNPHPTLEAVQEGVAGNLCRCGTYPKVYEAALKVSAK